MRNVFILGDSISIHYGPFLNELAGNGIKYDRKGGIEEALLDLDNPVGANGGDSRQVLAYLEEQQNAGREFDILLLNCGLHDIRIFKGSEGRQVGPDEYRENLGKIIILAGKTAVRTIWVESTPVNDELHNSLSQEMKRYNRDLVEYNEIAGRIMAENGIEVIPLYEFTLGLGTGAYCDHVHYLPEARKRQAEFIHGSICSILSK